MTIDAHCHLFDQTFMSDHYWSILSGWLAEDQGKIAGESITPEDVLRTVLPGWWDPTGERTIRQMDDAGIEVAVLLAEDVGLLAGEGSVSVEEQHRRIAGVAERHAGRFLFCPNIDPRRSGALELFTRCFQEWNARALKMYPPSGFLPDDEICYPFYERLSSWGFPLIVHTGGNYGYREGCHPARLDRILSDFPQLTVIACHLGGSWWRDLIKVGQRRPNLCTDISSFQVTAKGSYGRFGHILRRFLDEFGADRVLFGTDSPAYEHFVSSKEWAQIVQGLPDNPPEGMWFSQDEVRAVMRDSAARIFGLR